MTLAGAWELYELRGNWMPWLESVEFGSGMGIMSMFVAW
jgi:hypothetical protein